MAINYTHVQKPGWPYPVTMLLDDEFNTDLAAGSVHGTAAEPGPGTRGVADSGSYLSITSGQLRITQAITATNPAMWFTLYTARIAGKIFSSHFKMSSSTNSDGFCCGHDATEPWINNWPARAFNFYRGGILKVNSLNVSSIAIGLWSVNTDYYCIRLIRSTGDMWLIKGGAFSNWTLLFADTTNSDANLYPIAKQWNNAGDSCYHSFLRIPTTLWLPTPLLSDGFGSTFGTSDGLGHAEGVAGGIGAGGGNKVWTGATWSVSDGKAVNTPTVTGSELLTNGGFDTNTTGWTPQAEGSISSVPGGVSGNCCYHTGASQRNFYQKITSTVGLWYEFSFYHKNGTSKGMANFATNDYSSGGSGLSYRDEINDADWGLSKITQRATTTTLTCYASVASSNSTGNTYYDIMSLLQINSADLFASVQLSTDNIYSSVNIYRLAGVQSGLVIGLDSTTNPLYFIIIYIDNNYTTTYIKVDECVNGVYTAKSSTAITYSAGATLTVVKESSTLLRVFYNNAAVGSAVAVTSNTNTLHGLFSTNSNNSFDNFVVYPRGTGNEYSFLDRFSVE